jgi:hypothetical protein
MMSIMLGDYVLVAIFGALIGFTELISRYRDAPFKIARSWQALIYIFLNLVASLLALWLMRTFEITLGFDGEPAQIRWVQVMVAGLGAMVVFRSSVFVIRAGDKDVSIGPSSILQVLLDVLDREVDRNRAQQRAEAVRSEILANNIQFEEIRDALPIVAFAMMQNLQMEDQDDLLNKISRLSESTVSSSAKAVALGLALMNYLGEDVLRGALKLVKETKVAHKEEPASRDLAPRGKADLNAIAESILGPLVSPAGGDSNAAEDQPSQ